MAQYGYARVSSKEQHTDRQLNALEEFGITKENIFQDKQSGKDFKRPAWNRMLETVQPEDVLVVSSIDRMGRNYTEILEQWRVLTHEKQTRVVVLDMPLLDTRDKQDLTGVFIADLVLQLLSYIAETERLRIRQRQAEGIAAAKSRGVRFGRPRVTYPEGFMDAYKRWRAGDAKLQDCCEELQISKDTFYRYVRRLEGREKKPTPKDNSAAAASRVNGEEDGSKTLERTAV